MPNRMLRDWTQSEKMDILSPQAEVFFTRLIMKADDFGCFYADTRLVKANLFPLKLDKIREADLTRWMAECQKAGLIVLYASADKKRYMQINDFRQRLDKAKAKFPFPSENKITNDFRESGNDFPAELESEIEQNSNTKRANALVGIADPPINGQILKNKYQELLKAIKGKETKEVWVDLKTFISVEKPQFIEPYVDVWRLFAINYKLPSIDSISDSRRKKFKTRIAEPAFDFFKVLERIKISGHLKGDNQRGWTVTFDWIIENDKNYLKIMEGQYN